MSRFSRNIQPHVDAELHAAVQSETAGDASTAFAHLERAHILGQSSTFQHVRVHWHMFLWGLRQRNLRESLGQVLRMLGAATNTAAGLVPEGNTGGSNISPFKRLPLPADLATLIDKARA